MKPVTNIFKFRAYPPLAISIITAAISLILPFIFAGIFYLIGILIGFHDEDLGNFVAYLLTGSTVAVICFYICKAHPKSIWYAPVICNAVTLLAGIGNYMEANPGVALPFAIGWLLSIFASIRGRNIGLQMKPKTKIH